jgi:hypothetical protein
MFAAADAGRATVARDWLMALAASGQARHLAAMLEAGEARSDPENPASRLLETWREARARREGARAQPRR